MVGIGRRILSGGSEPQIVAHCPVNGVPDKRRKK